jgi:ubiquinone/menaquinone biosynthesis C-methylase UbiE
MVAKLGLRAGDRVLDIACGTGLGFAALESALGPDGEIVGVDFTPEMLARAARHIARRGWSNVRLVEADARTLPFGDGTFSGVCSTLALGAPTGNACSTRPCGSSPPAGASQ